MKDAVFCSVVTGAPGFKPTNASVLAVSTHRGVVGRFAERTIKAPQLQVIHITVS